MKMIRPDSPAGRQTVVPLKSGMTRGLRAVVMAGCTAAVVLSAPAAMADAGGRDDGGAIVNGNGSWAVMAGSSLKATLEGWSRAAGWTVVWDSPIDYQLRANATFNGAYEEAVGRLVDSIYQSNPELHVTLYRGNHVIHIREQSLSN